MIWMAIFRITSSSLRLMNLEHCFSRILKVSGILASVVPVQKRKTVRLLWTSETGHIVALVILVFVIDSDSWTMASEKTDSGFDGIIMIMSASPEFVANAMISVIMSCNPTITEYGAQKVSDALLTEQTTYKGVTYTFAITGDYYTMTAVAKD